MNVKTIYEIFSWPKADKQIKRYLFTTYDAANNFKNFLNKIFPDYPHEIKELNLYDIITLDEYDCEKILELDDYLEKKNK